MRTAKQQSILAFCTGKIFLMMWEGNRKIAFLFLKATAVKHVSKAKPYGFFSYVENNFKAFVRSGIVVSDKSFLLYIYMFKFVVLCGRIIDPKHCSEHTAALLVGRIGEGRWKSCPG